MKLPLFLFSVSMFLISCTQNAYKPPMDGDIATITFVNNGTSNGRVEFFENNTNCSGRTLSYVMTPDRSHDLKVKANIPLTLSFGYSAGFTTVCRQYLTMEPKNGKRYKITARGENKKCFFAVYEIENDISLPHKVMFRDATNLFLVDKISDTTTAFCH